MPRKPKLDKKTINVLVNGQAIAVTLYPPKAPRVTWYAYWAGLKASKSTGQREFDQAVVAVETMLRNGGERVKVDDSQMTDEEFEAIQRRHFSKRTDPSAKARAEKSLANCLDAVAAFCEISGLPRIVAATPDDCAEFQRTALNLPSGWRKRPLSQRQPVEYFSEKARQGRQKAGQPDPLDDRPRYSPNNVLRWSRNLQAAFERANRNALKRKCVRGVVSEEKLLSSNPWSNFTWIEGTQRPIRQFDGSELASVLTFLETKWSKVQVAAIAAKVFLWSGCRKMEIAGLRWDMLRVVGNEYHFEITGKWGIERWFRIPETVYQELLDARTKSPYVFAAYTTQLHQMHASNPNYSRKIAKDFNPRRFGAWFYERIKSWSKASPAGRAFVHIFRKTSLQYVRRGEDIARQVASDARVSESVLMTNYVKETDEEMRQRSNRTYHRILAGLPPEVAARYGHVASGRSELESRLRSAVASKDWACATEIAQQLSEHDLAGSA